MEDLIEGLLQTLEDEFREYEFFIDDIDYWTGSFILEAPIELEVAVERTVISALSYYGGRIKDSYVESDKTVIFEIKYTP